MAGRDGMTIEEVVRQVLRDEHGDVIGESVRAVAHARGFLGTSRATTRPFRCQGNARQVSACLPPTASFEERDSQKRRPTPRPFLDTESSCDEDPRPATARVPLDEV